MVISILDSWKEFDTNFAVVKTSEGIFIISRGQTSYAIEHAVEHFTVVPCRVSQKRVYMYWPVGENPMDLSKTSKEFGDDLSRIKDLTGTDPFVLMEIAKDKEQ